MTYIVLYYNIP